MTSLYARSVLCALGLFGLSASAWGQGYSYSSPSLLEPQSSYAYPITAAGYRAPGEGTLPSPSDMNQPMNAPMQAAPMQAAPALPPQQGAMAGDYQRAMSQSWGDPGQTSAPSYGQGASYGSGSCDAGLGGDCFGGCGGKRGGGWFGYAGGLVLTRENCANTSLAYNNITGLTNLQTGMADLRTAGGLELAVGKWFCGCNVGIEAVYWGVYPGTQSYNLAGSVGTGYPTSWQQYNGIAYNNPAAGVVPFYNYFTAAQRMYIARDFDVNSVEINLIGNAWNLGGCGGGCGGGIGYGGGCGSSCGSACGSSCGRGGYSPLTVGWLGGFRYFQFTDNLLWQTDNGNGVINGGNDEASYVNNITNQLYGFQLGGYLNYQLGCRWSVYGGAKAGIYDNQITSTKRLYGPAGDAYINNGGPYQGQALNYHNTYNNLAMLAQLDAGARCQLGCHWAVRAGYRVVGVGGLATVENQFQQNYNDYGSFTQVNCNGSLFLHGAYAGAEFCW